MNRPAILLSSCGVILGALLGYLVGSSFSTHEDDAIARIFDKQGVAYDRWGRNVVFQLLSNDKSGNIKSVGYTNRHVEIQDILIVSSLKSCHVLSFQNCSFSDFESLSSLKNFDKILALFLTNCNITDLNIIVLAQLNNVKCLYLSDNRTITDASVDALLKLNWLHSISVSGTAMTDKGINELRKGLPNIVIMHKKGEILKPGEFIEK